MSVEIRNGKVVVKKVTGSQPRTIRPVGNPAVQRRQASVTGPAGPMGPSGGSSQRPASNTGPMGPMGPPKPSWGISSLEGARNQASALVEAIIRSRPDGSDGPSGPSGGGGGGGGGYAAPPPLRLPRMAMPSPELLAAQLYAAVGAATSPYQEAIGQLAGQRTNAQAGISQADRDAAASMDQAAREWRAATGQISGQIADVYRTALSGLAGFIGGNNAAMMNAGFAPSNTGGNEAYSRLAGLGASAQEASLARMDMGEQAVRGDTVARGQITQAGNQSLAASYAQVLGGLNLQKAAAEAAARAEQVNREFALRQEIDRINFDAASQEAMANR